MRQIHQSFNKFRCKFQNQKSFKAGRIELYCRETRCKICVFNSTFYSSSVYIVSWCTETNIDLG